MEAEGDSSEHDGVCRGEQVGLGVGLEVGVGE